MRFLTDPAMPLLRRSPGAGDQDPKPSSDGAGNRRKSALHVRGLSKRYGNLQALKAVGLQLNRGEFVALLGPNGAGKTTLFNILTGLVPPDEGAVRILGHSLRERPHVQQANIGIIFQQLTIDLDMTVMQNLQFHARLHGVPRKQRETRILDALATIGLAGEEQRLVRNLSGGNRRRAELARALLHEPKLLLMDEPTAGLDPASRRDLLSRVHALSKEQDCGVLWSTQLVDEVESADKIIILDRGAISAVMPPRELCEVTRKATLNEAFLALTGDARI